ncbi:heme ABC superfamily ATP binding cassette transporter, binding protein [Sporosarcina newyorkensis 2681]|uniref:Heme ABC superfamily ATP binding cassette transporter, binding protein n=1 Tax=Sporosarcina newyorkensis 2681 TaxID=1027292 RepID=F9DU34_9BACL|nr:ABC transporter substrate-binding protein [Sporosarcina newyorkensis]EGQ25218.1 heme ABC superfamily ATP binding cassette transporter, binding protein [Sporosarcina newyorkensis 2681]
MCKKYMLLFVIMVMAILTACGESDSTKGVSASKADGDKSKNEGIYEPVSVETKDGSIQYEEMPRRVVTQDLHTLELMLTLGLEEHIAGTVGANPNHVLPEFKEAFSRIPVVSRGMQPSKEVLLEVDPDFVYAGWDTLFQEERLGSVKKLNELGIKTYTHESSNIIGPTLDDVYQDIRNIGLIFKVEDRADELIESLQHSIRDVGKQIDEQIGTVEEPVSVFIYDSGTDIPFTATQTILTEMIRLAGGENIFGDIPKNWTTVNWEDVVERNPKVIVIMDYGEMTAEQKKDVLFSNPALAGIDAIKNDRVAVMPLDYTFEGVRIPTTIEMLAKSFYPEAFEN